MTELQGCRGVVTVGKPNAQVWVTQPPLIQGAQQTGQTLLTRGAQNDGREQAGRLRSRQVQALLRQRRVRSRPRGGSGVYGQQQHSSARCKQAQAASP